MSDTATPPGGGAEGSSEPSGRRSLLRRLWEHPWRRNLLWVVAVVLAVGVGWRLAGGGSAPDHRETLPDAGPGAGLDPEAAAVTTEPVAFRPVQRAVEAVGTLHGFEEITLGAKVEGRIRKVFRDVADRVKPGDVLLEIDPTDYELSLQQAERGLQVELAKLGLTEPPTAGVDLAKLPTVMQAQVRMDNAKSRMDRVSRLRSTQAVTAEEMDNATSDYRAAQAEHANQLLMARSGLATIQLKQTALAVAQQQLKDTQVRVPTPTQPVPGCDEGVGYAVTQRAVSEGTLVRAGTEVCKLVIDRTLKLRVPVPERHGAEVKTGQKVEVYTAASAKPTAGTVTRINPAVDPVTRTFEVEILVPNPDGELKPGNFAKAAILTRLDPEAATVPLAALVNFAGINKVFLAENGKAREVRVTLGVQTAEWAEVAEPALPRGAMVITSGQTALAADSPVLVRAAAHTPPARAVLDARGGSPR